MTLIQQVIDENFIHPLLPIADHAYGILKSDVHLFFSQNYSEVATSSTSLLMDTVSSKDPVAKILPIKGNSMEGHSKNSSSESDIMKSGSETNRNLECMDTCLSPLEPKCINPLLYDFDTRSPSMLPSPSETKFDHSSSCRAEATNMNATIDNTGIEDMEDDTAVLLDEIVNKLLET